jgi:hypothetical protein
MEKEFYKKLYDNFQQYEWDNESGFIPSETETKKTVSKVIEFLLEEYSSCNPIGSYEYERVNFLLKVKNISNEKLICKHYNCNWNLERGTYLCSNCNKDLTHELT